MLVPETQRTHNSSFGRSNRLTPLRSKPHTDHNDTRSSYSWAWAAPPGPKILGQARPGLHVGSDLDLILEPERRARSGWARACRKLDVSLVWARLIGPSQAFLFGLGSSLICNPKVWARPGSGFGSYGRAFLSPAWPEICQGVDPAILWLLLPR
jgi:hypothetical protein